MGEKVQLIGFENTDANLGVVSLPVPGDSDYRVSVSGAQCQSVPVGFWPRSETVPGGPKRTRRALVFFERQAADAPAADLEPGAPQGEAGTTGWSVDVVRLQNLALHRDETHYHYLRQPCEVRLSFGGRQTTFSLAIDNDSGLHRWQYVVVQKLWGGPLVEAYRIGGHIYTSSEERLTMAKLQEIGGLTTLPDDTIAANAYLLVFANGTVQVTAHWTNGRIYGAVGDQKGVPAVVFGEATLPDGPWDGSSGRIGADGVRLNLDPSAHLVSDEHAGRFRQVDGESLWQPFESTRIVLRHDPREGGAVEDIVVNNSSEGLVQGASRSATWMMGLGDADPVIGRYVAPPEWYARCSEFAPFPVELAEGEFDRLGRVCAEALLRNSTKGSFMSGGIYRYLDQYGLGCYEFAMDANEARSLFLRSYRDSDPRFHDLALRNAYFMADIATDSSRDIIHYHNDRPEWLIYSLIYQRFSGMVLGYLETGDYYLLETAEAVARNYMSQHLQNWPRLGIGRDADPLTGFLLLWDYTGKEEYFRFAREFAHDVSLVVSDEGKWLCGSGVGPMMGVNAFEGTSWNGGHFLNGFTEYAMRDPDVPQEWLESAGRALRKLFDYLEQDHGGYHPASSGFLGRIHWYLACRLGDAELIERTRRLLGNVLERAAKADEPPIFTGPSGHHQNNYADFLIFYEATKDTLPNMR